MPERVDCSEVLRAATDPGRLAFYLNDYGITGICSRLGCDTETALRLQLHATPDAYEWGRSIQVISRALLVDPSAVASLLAEVLARPAATVPAGK